MEHQSKLYTVFFRHETIIPVATVLAKNAEEAEFIGSSIPIEHIKLCKECEKLFDDANIDTGIEVELLEDQEDAIAPFLEETDYVRTEAKKDEPVILEEKIQTTDVISYSGSRRGFKFIEATPNEKANNKLPEHIKSYIMSDEEEKKEKLKDRIESLNDMYGYAWD